MIIDISVIIVNWNTKKLLLECIESLQQETKKANIEIIVVDNDSSDGSQESVKTSFPNVHLICNKKNVGFAQANNIGIEQSKGRYVCLVNSDIKALDNVLDHLFLYMDSNRSVGAVGPKTVNVDMSVRKNCREIPTLKNAFNESLFFDKIFSNIKSFRGRSMTWFSHDETRSVEVLSGCFLMVRREVLNTVGLLDDQFFIYGEDVDWCKRICSVGWEIIFYADTKVIHYAGASSAAAPVRYLIERIKSNLYYWQKHHSPFERFSYIIILLMNYSVRLCIWTILFFIKFQKKDKITPMIKGYKARISWLLFNRGRKDLKGKIRKKYVYSR